MSIYSIAFISATRAHLLPILLCSRSRHQPHAPYSLAQSRITHLSPFIPMTRLPSATHRSKSLTVIRPVLRTPCSSRCRLITPGKNGALSRSSGVTHSGPPSPSGTWTAMFANDVSETRSSSLDVDPGCRQCNIVSNGIAIPALRAASSVK
jgi:hypothetical protein